MARAGKIPGDPSDTEQLQLLSRIRWLSDAARAKLATEGRLIRYRARRPIYFEHGTADRIFFLLAGIAKIYYTYRKQRILVGHLGPGDTFGVEGLTPSRKHRYSSEAVSDCAALSMDPEIFAQTVLGNSLDRIGPPLANTFGHSLELLARYTHFLRLGTRGRLAMSLLEMARKFGIRDSRGVLLPLTVSHAELGTMVGASRQHITMQLKDFEREGFIVRDRRRLIVLPERLEATLES
jgi:CRP/FNR family transcriptional regulator, cyclic AMP receptor protein